MNKNFLGVLTSLEAPNLAADLPTPYIGIWERINIGVFMLWVVVLAIVLLQRVKPEPVETLNFQTKSNPNENQQRMA